MFACQRKKHLHFKTTGSMQTLGNTSSVLCLIGQKVDEALCVACA